MMSTNYSSILLSTTVVDYHITTILCTIEFCAWGGGGGGGLVSSHRPRDGAEL